MKRILQVLLLVVLAGGAFWLWRTLFPSDETQIRRRLAELAEVASISGDEGNIARIRRLDQLSRCLTPDVVVRYVPDGGRGATFNGRDEIQSAAAAAPQLVRSVKVEFVDVDVEPVPSGSETARASLTAKVQVAGERDFGVQAMKVELAKDKDFGWRLKRLETFRPLSQE